MAPRTSYGSITVKHDEDELATLVTQNTSFASVNTNKKKYYAAVGVLLLLATAAVFGGFGGGGVIHQHGSSSSDNGSSSIHKGGSSTTTTIPTFDIDKGNVLSTLSPVDLGFRSIERELDASPSKIWGKRTGPLPTNSWYLNLVSNKAAYKPDDATRAYTVPYIIDTAPPETIMAGIRVHWPVVSASDRNIQMVDDFKNGLCLGSSEVSKQYQVDSKYPLSPLGVSLEWAADHDSDDHDDDKNTNNKNKKSMTSHIVRGMPFATMQYYGGALPTIYSYNGPAANDENAILVDGKHGLQCGTMEEKSGKPVTVEQDVELHFINSDFTWGVFFSKPVQVSCAVADGDEKTRDFQLSVVKYDQEMSNDDVPLTVRVALLNTCTTGKSNIKSHCSSDGKATEEEEAKQFSKLMKESASVFATSPQLHFSYPDSSPTSSTTAERVANVTIDWGAQTSATDKKSSSLLMFAMPHHQDYLDWKGSGVEVLNQCVQTFHGNTCLVRGNIWTLSEDMGQPMSFNAPRPPAPDSIPLLATALADDIHYQLSDNMLRGAADTYFPGKILARLARVIMIASEMKSLAESAASSSGGTVEGLLYAADIDDKTVSKAAEAAASENLPSDGDISKAVERLKKGVQIWLSEDSEAPFVFDKSWGGFVNCGCRYTGKDSHGSCNNTFPDCPALVDVNEDFGNGYYNDHHYHYGYHIYAAAVVAKFDPKWGEEYFDKVLLYIRDFANPSPAEEYFTQFRQKDWFLGSSWASGIVSAENSPHGRNEESSSEAIAAYEAIALYGSVMVDVFGESSGDDDKLKTAKLVRDVGQLLTVTELRATNRYWHVWSSDDHVNTYPSEYKQPVVGMLYDTMASFQTWFAPWAVVSYGIQLMPFTAIAEERDDPAWATELYPLYDEACQAAGEFCVDNGWSILQAGLYAETGEREKALEQALSIPTEVFSSLGGSGNSLSNMIWFIATRRAVVSTSVSSKASLNSTAPSS